MARFILSSPPGIWRKGSTAFLAFSFLFGLFSGIAAFFAYGESVLPWMRSVLYSPVSIVGILCVTVLPFLFSAFAVFISKPWLLFLISFWKAMFFSFFSLGFLVSNGSAGWLIRWLLMFSDLICLPVLYFYWQRSLLQHEKASFAEGLVFFSLLLFIGSMDYRMIAPILSGLIS